VLEKHTEKLATLDECLALAQGKKHLMLGNGFSRACRNNIFSYDSLFETADFKKLSKHAKQTFEALETTDFEFVMRSLNTASALIKLYEDNSDNELAQTLAEDADKLRKVLVETIAAHHPSMPSDITDDEYLACRTFLDKFDKIYTLNYDLLLYWANMKALQGDKRRDDGFRDPYFGEPEDYVEEDYVEWSNPDHKQDIHYLHGALHLFYQGPSLQKYCWRRTGVRLLEQIDTALKKGFFPLIVSEGSSDQKFERVQRSNYLGHNYRSLGKITGSLFIYGHSLAENDTHILEQLRKNTKLTNLYVSVYGSLTDKGNQSILQTAGALATGRPKTKPLTIAFYCAKSAHVWGK
jgi:hypothetical protein